MSNPNVSLAEMAKRIAQLETENQALKKASERSITMKVAEGGGLSVYGMGRFPVTLFQEQWLKLLATEGAIKEYISLHQDVLDLKGDDDAVKATKAALRKAQGFVSKATREAEEAAAAAAPAVAVAPKTTVAPSTVKVSRHPARS